MRSEANHATTSMLLDSFSERHRTQTRARCFALSSSRRLQQLTGVFEPVLSQ